MVQVMSTQSVVLCEYRDGPNVTYMQYITINGSILTNYGTLSRLLTFTVMFYV